MKIIKRNRYTRHVGYVDDTDVFRKSIVYYSLPRIYSDEVTLPDYKFCMNRYSGPSMPGLAWIKLACRKLEVFLNT